jgi:hypothetical protein
MNISLWKYMAVLALVAVMAITATSCGNADSTPARVNIDVIAYQEFAIDAKSVGQETSAAGTIFVKGNPDKVNDRSAVITAQVKIDPADWAGIGFSIPQGWEVTAITSDYPQGNLTPNSYISTLYTGSEVQPYKRIIEIGNTRHGAALPQGGTGNVIIELSPDSGNQDLGEYLAISIAVGSTEDYIVGPVHEVFPVSLK